MKKYFVVSLIENGILGGGITADTEAITYRTGKLTVPAEYRNLVMKYKDISSVKSGWLLFLPTVSVMMKNRREYRFAVFFSRKKLLKILADMGVGA